GVRRSIACDRVVGGAAGFDGGPDGAHRRELLRQRRGFGRRREGGGVARLLGRGGHTPDRVRLRGRRVASVHRDCGVAGGAANDGGVPGEASSLGRFAGGGGGAIGRVESSGATVLRARGGRFGGGAIGRVESLGATVFRARG